MESRVIFSPFPSKLPHSTPPPPSQNIKHLPILCSSASPNNSSQHISTNNGKSKETNSPPNLNIRYRARSRRQMAKQEKKQKQEEEAEEGLQKEAKPSKKKKWEEMKLSEKALEVYMGEKGLLFWLNKLAYASIFVVIGGWIIFRFIGPSLGLYQLDSQPLSPSSLLNGG